MNCLTTCDPGVGLPDCRERTEQGHARSQGKRRRRRPLDSCLTHLRSPLGLSDPLEIGSRPVDAHYIAVHETGGRERWNFVGIPGYFFIDCGPIVTVREKANAGSHFGLVRRTKLCNVEDLRLDVAGGTP